MGERITCPTCDTEWDVEEGLTCPEGHRHPDSTNNPDSDPAATTRSGRQSNSHDAGETQCENCGETVNHTDIFCRQCGTRLREEGLIEAKFCPTCGTERPETRSVDDGEIILKTDGVDVSARDGEKIGAKLRNIAFITGRSKEKAQKIHREHVQFEMEGDGWVMEVLGENPTVLNGQNLSKGRRVEVADGDTLELSDVLTAELSLG